MVTAMAIVPIVRLIMATDMGAGIMDGTISTVASLAAIMVVAALINCPE